jgi:hypothetical protein
MKKDTTEEMLDKYSLVKKTLTDKGYTLVSANSVNSFITSRIEYWYINIYKAFILASVIMFIVSFFTSGETTIGSLITAYSTLSLSIIMIMLILINNILKVSQGQSVFNLILSILFTAGPFLLMFAIIGLMLYCIISYSAAIGKGNVSGNYYTFSNIVVILFLLQIYMLYGNIISDKFQQTGKISKVTLGMVYLVGTITGICSIIIYTILKYFTTDG